MLMQEANQGIWFIWERGKENGYIYRLEYKCANEGDCEAVEAGSQENT